MSLILCFYLIFLTSIIICLADFVDLYKYYLNITSIKKAKKFIKNTSAIKIGITGTNGKTSIKNYLNKILSVKYKTVATPKNYNTPKGIISTINSINSEVDCLIFEMGARQKNDIKKLCCLTNIDLGIISNVSCQHLETFKSIDNIYKTKKELSNFLNKKLCVYNYNNVHTRHMYKTKTGDKFIIAVFERYSPHIKQNKIIKLNKKSNYMCFYSREYKINLYANNIHLNNGSTHFTIHYCNKTFLAETKLLGTHNISNLLLASAIALNLDIDIQTIINKISEITPVEHRLQLIKGRLNILDDSYNCSLESAKASLNVLKEFDGLKIVCTPGIIEGGKNQDYLNSCLFEEIEKVADVIIIIGKTNLKTFKNKMSKKIVYYLDNLDQAKPYFNKFKDGSTLLILNDLPDD